MKVLHVITGLQTGGAERMLANLCIASRKAGNSPVVVALCPGGSQYERLREAGVSVFSLGMKKGVPSISGLVRLAQLLRRECPDVVQSWMYHADLYSLLALWLSGRRRDTRLYWGVRCSDMDLRRYGLVLRLTVRLCAWLSRSVDGIVVNSQAGARIHRRLGYPARRMTVIDNGFDTESFRPDASHRQAMRRSLGLSDDAFVVGCVARLDEMKDFPTLGAALDLLDDVTCITVGKDTEAVTVARGMIALGERSDVPRLLNGFDLLISASAFGEGFSNAIGEAMATGIPVVATDVGDARRILGDAGRIVPPRNPRALAQAVAEMRDNVGMRQAMGRAARHRIEQHFSLRHSLAAFEALYSRPGKHGGGRLPIEAVPQRGVE
jgi:glycosyltransferase involved in cell wall biosynthesis